MTFRTKLDPETLLLNTYLAYLDNLTPGSGLEEPASAADQNLAFDINAIRTLLRHHLTGGTGSRKWYDAPLDGFGLDQVHDKKLAFPTGLRPGTSDFTLGSSLGGVLVDSTMLPSASPLIAVGASSTTSGGYLAATEANFTSAGTLGVGTSQVTDAAGTLVNRVAIVDAATNAAPKTVDDEEIFGLLQTVDGTSDGTAVTGATVENLQISFVYLDAATDTITATTLPAGSYHFGTIRQSSFYDLPLGAIVGGAGLPEIVDPTQQILKVPFREIDITGTSPAANDPMTLLTGTFTTAGAQTVTSQFGTPALPATGADFVSDPRIKVWVDGVKVSKGANSGAGRDVYWISATQLAFAEKLKTGKSIVYVEAPASY